MSLSPYSSSLCTNLGIPGLLEHTNQVDSPYAGSDKTQPREENWEDTAVQETNPEEIQDLWAEVFAAKPIESAVTISTTMTQPRLKDLLSVAQETGLASTTPPLPSPAPRRLSPGSDRYDAEPSRPTQSCRRVCSTTA